MKRLVTGKKTILSRLKRGVRRLKLGLLWRANRLAHTMEMAVTPPGNWKDQLPFRPILIVGPPRTGSTLFYQSFSAYFDVGYFSNLHDLFYGMPSIIERFLQVSSWHRTIDFESTRGATKGLLGPSESWDFWYRFFRRKPLYVPDGEADPTKLMQLRKAVALLGHAFGKPVLFKQMNCTVRLRPIGRALPEALFIVMRRDELENARSLLEARYRVFGDYKRWWSTEPPEIQEIRQLPPHEQVVEQIRKIHALIERDANYLGREKFHWVDYESFCADTRKTFDGIEKFLATHGVVLNKTGFRIPVSFERRRGTQIDPEVYDALKAYVESAC